MTPYSQDLRERILETVRRGDGSLRQIARRFLVSVSFVTRLLRLHRSTGALVPRPHGGGNPAALGPEDLERLRELVRQQPDATLEELRQRLGVACSTMAISRALRKLGLPRKKKVPRAQEQDSPEVQENRREFCEKLAGVDPELRPGDVVIWDNPQPHLSEDAVEAVEAAGARVVPLPPYSPDLTPIEEMFSKVKGAMRSAAARTTETVYAAFCSALHDVTPDDIAGWFGDRAAYAMQP